MTTRSGLAASTGIAIGPLFIYEPIRVQVEHHKVDDIAAEQARYDDARRGVEEALQATIARMEAEGKESEAGIFEIQMEFLDDPTFGLAIHERIGAESINAETVVQAVTAELVEEFSTLDDEYFAQRAADIEDLGRRLVRQLMNVTDSGFDGLTRPSIVVAHDLAPSDTASLKQDLVLGIVTEVGSATSHTAILSRGLGIPSIVGLGPLDAQTGQDAVLDALGGKLLLTPDADTLNEYRARKASFDERREELVSRALEPARTSDGKQVEVVANIGSVAEARQSIEFGAEGAGLVRTEFLFLDRTDLPDEEEQYRMYRGIADVYGTRPIVVRTLDIGGDKPLPALPMPHEENPFLGRRAIRLALDEPEKLLYPQLRALLRAAVGRGIKIMFPMVAHPSEVRRLRAALDRCRGELDEQGLEYARDLEIGIMVEIPAAAIGARTLAPLVDFFSIGTNDLTQYTLAVDRTNESVASIADYFAPAVLELIRIVIDASHASGIWTGMCGEMAGDPLALPLLLGLGLDEFSMSPAAIPDAKDRLRNLSRERCRDIAARCLRAPDAAAVRAILSRS